MRAEETDSEARRTVECAIAMVWPEGMWAPVCEMFRVDHRTMTWTSKHYSDGATFDDAGRLHNGETARSLAESGTGSGIHRYLRRTAVTFVVASLEESQFEATRPTDWTLERLKGMPDANVSTFHD